MLIVIPVNPDGDSFELLVPSCLKSKKYCIKEATTLNKVKSKRSLGINDLLTLHPLRRTAVFPKSANKDSLPVYNTCMSFESH